MSDPKLESEAVCEACGKPVDPAAPGVVRAVTMSFETMGMADWMEGMGVYFHDDCYPYGSGDYRMFS